MNTVLRIVVGISAVLFASIGVGWWLAPTAVGEQFGMMLLEGRGLSTQIGDLASFFLTLGSCILIGLRTGERIWFYPAIMLLSLAAVSRTIAWVFHDAALAYDMIAVELILSAVLYWVSGTLTNDKNPEIAQ